MDLQTVTQIISNFGVAIGFCIYFAWRDVKYMQKLDSTLDMIKEHFMKEENIKNEC